FFFQAEDGIRDGHVTGVQTCALPIYHPPLAVLRRRAGRAQVPLPPAVEARDRGGRRHLGIGGRLRPLHPPIRLRHQQPVLEGAEIGRASCRERVVRWVWRRLSL